MRFWEGYQCKEIAVILNCSPAAVTLLMQRAFNRLRIYLLGK
ncbi:MAG: sigma factor-like helix-turn-helix DNA-binding protein [Eisenbergiella porci]|nr:sigma factor-like helix-turn-helix DNA-binding protein [Eisenbergiella porci]MDY2654613.1 sigma factor-like helix-turn-helix DNA-binding protein [Eisenbergiella porci]